MKKIAVAVGIITNQHNQILITRRAKTALQGDKWEFPGGKVEDHETVYDALCRELKEEVQIIVQQAEPLLQVPYDYEEISVLLDVWRVLDYQGEPQPAEGQPMRWVELSALSQYSFPAANERIIERICI